MKWSNICFVNYIIYNIVLLCLIPEASASTKVHPLSRSIQAKKDPVKHKSDDDYSNAVVAPPTVSPYDDDSDKAQMPIDTDDGTGDDDSDGNDDDGSNDDGDDDGDMDDTTSPATDDGDTESCEGFNGDDDSIVTNPAVSPTFRAAINKDDDEAAFDDDFATEEAIYEPLLDAKCFNDQYNVPILSQEEQLTMYYEYAFAFDLLNEGTGDDTVITKNRIPGLFLRTCFHDNTIDDQQPDFRSYVSSMIDPNTKEWIGATSSSSSTEPLYMSTSGSDASNLLCDEERTHPNNHHDQTATRVLQSIQTYLKSVSTVYEEMSYADLLHNGCNAATIYLTGNDPVDSLLVHPFSFGRHDSCYTSSISKCGRTKVAKHVLCGHSDLLPIAGATVTDATQWFLNRGASQCTMMGLLWTHTLVEDMGSMCPISKLPCTTSESDIEQFVLPSTDLYFQDGSTLDYFDYFLGRGTHTIPVNETGDDGHGECNWLVDSSSTSLTHWPLLHIDCEFSVSHIQSLSNSNDDNMMDLVTVIKNFVHNSQQQYNRYDILRCGLHMLSDMRQSQTSACDIILPTECQYNPNHMFGAYTTTPTNSK